VSWNFFGDLSKMPSFSSRSPICQAAMLSFSQGKASTLALTHGFRTPQPKPPGNSRRLLPMPQFPGCARFLMDQISGRCTGRVRIQSGLDRCPLPWPVPS
jgi:hypothetical protein